MKKGDLGSTIIMWLAVISVAIVVSSWFASNIDPLQAESKIVEHDLTQMFNRVERACSSSFYSSNYIPQLTKGSVNFNETLLCINTTLVNKCRILACEISESFSANFSDIMHLSFSKDDDGLVVEGVELD